MCCPSGDYELCHHFTGLVELFLYSFLTHESENLDVPMPLPLQFIQNKSTLGCYFFKTTASVASNDAPKCKQYAKLLEVNQKKNYQPV